MGVCNNIKESNLWSAIFTSCFSHRFATTSRSPTCGRPSSPAASLTGLQQHQGVQPVVGHHHQLLLSQVCNNIKESNLWSANITSCFSHRGGGVLDPGHINKAMEEFFWTRHGGARGRRRRGKPWVSGEEHQEGGVQSCSPSTWWTSTRESESESESEMDSSSDLAAGVNCQSVFVSW